MGEIKLVEKEAVRGRVQDAKKQVKYTSQCRLSGDAMRSP